jgi:hypothetical protein
MVIPPPGSDPGSIADAVDNLVIESAHDVRRTAFLDEAERGLNLYLGEHFLTADSGDVYRVVLNRIQNIIVSLVAIQAGDPPKITFTPRETGEPALFYLNTKLPEAQAVAQQISGFLPPYNVDQQGNLILDDTGMPMPFDITTQPLPMPAVQQIQMLIAQGQQATMAAQQQGLPEPYNPYPPELLAEVSDATTAEALQIIFDGMWEECDGQFVFTENTLNKNVLGWQPTLYEFDDDQKRHILTNIHPKHVFVDPLYSDSSRWQYCIFEQPLSADEAVAKWPFLEKQIRDNAKEGTIIWAGQRVQDQASMYNQQFRRDMISVRTAWVRYQPYPMDKPTAVAKGLVEERTVPDESMAQAGAPQGEEILSNGSSGGADAQPVATVPSGGISGDGSRGNGGGLLAEDDRSVAGATAGPNLTQDGGADQGQYPTRLACFLPGTDTEVDETHPQWPTRPGIRQITIVAQHAVDDRESEFGPDEIPITANRNVAIPFSPYGQGEPKRLESMNMAINRILTSMVTYQAYNAYPPQLIWQAVNDRLNASLKEARIKAKTKVVVPNDLQTVLGGDLKKALTTLDVQDMPADFWKLLDLLLQLIDKEGNQADVTQGDASASWSGEAIQSLQNAASQIIRGKSLYTEFYLKQTAKLMVQSISHRLTSQDWAKYLSSKPIQAIEALHSHNKSMDKDISVEIRSASGASKAQQTQNIIGARKMGIPISDDTIMERLELDPDAERQKARAQAMQAPAPQPGKPGANNQQEQRAA